MTRQVIGTASSSVDVGSFAFGRAPDTLGHVVQRLLRVLEEQGHSAEEHDVDVRVRRELDVPVAVVTVEVLAGECGEWRDVRVGVPGRPFRVWCELELFHHGDHQAHRGDDVHRWARPEPLRAV